MGIYFERCSNRLIETVGQQHPTSIEIVSRPSWEDKHRSNPEMVDLPIWTPVISASSFVYPTGIGDTVPPDLCCLADSLRESKFGLAWNSASGPSSLKSRIGHRPIAVNPGDLGRDFGNACRELRCNGLKV